MPAFSPVLKVALAINTSVWISSWSPPEWIRVKLKQVSSKAPWTTKLKVWESAKLMQANILQSLESPLQGSSMFHLDKDSPKQPLCSQSKPTEVYAQPSSPTQSCASSQPAFLQRLTTSWGPFQPLDALVIRTPGPFCSLFKSNLNKDWENASLITW